MPEAGEWKLWVRYRDWRGQTELFAVRVEQAGAKAQPLVFGEKPGRDVTRWFSDAAALSRYGIPTLNYGTSTGLMDVELGENLAIDGLVQTAHTYALVAQRICG